MSFSLFSSVIFSPTFLFLPFTEKSQFRYFLIISFLFPLLHISCSTPFMERSQSLLPSVFLLLPPTLVFLLVPFFVFSLSLSTSVSFYPLLLQLLAFFYIFFLLLFLIKEEYKEQFYKIYYHQDSSRK